MEQQSPTPERPDAVKPDHAAPPPVPAIVLPPAPDGAPSADAPGLLAPEAAEPPAPPLTPMGWLQQNSPFLLVFVAALVALLHYSGYDWKVFLDWVIRAAEVLGGLGFVIFIHELGHFLAAKWCNVHVQTFSLGFGPALPGCSYKLGETTYKIGILPLGGFVQMVGEGSEADEDENYPRSFKNKTVFQRMIIISAGVVMNVLLGCVCFVIVYQFHGVEMPPAAVEAVEAGSPAWKEGIPSGSVFTKIGSTADPTFEDLQESVALTWWDAPVHLEFTTRDGQAHQTSILPRHDDNDLQPVIGVKPPSRLTLFPKKYLEDYDHPARRHSAAEAARVLDLRPGDVVVKASDPDKNDDEVADLEHDAKKGTFDAAELCRRMRGLGERDMVIEVLRDAVLAGAGAGPEKLVVTAHGFEPDDVIEGTTDPDQPDHLYEIKTLALRPGAAGKEFDYYDYQERMKRLAGKPVVVRVLREAAGAGESVTSSLATVLVPPAFHVTLGLTMKMGKVSAVRDRSPASDKVQPGDRIVAAKVMTGETLLGQLPRDNEPLDPVRLPFELEQAAAHAPKGAPVQVVLTVTSYDQGTHVEDGITKPLTLDWDDAWRFDQELPFNPSSAMAIPELGIAYRVESTVVHVEPGSAADKAGLKPSDRIEEISFKQSEKDKPGKWGFWRKMKSIRTKWGGKDTEEVYDQWAHYFYVLQITDSSEVKVRVWRDGAQLPQEIEMTAVPDESWPLVDRGLVFLPDLKLQKADNFLQAIGMGMGRTWSSIRKIYKGLVSMARGLTSFTENVEGPVNIASLTFQAAKQWNTLLLVLGMISVNLAVVNFLPIPVLDGGHMVFLIYELVRRKPPSDAVRAVASYVGLALLGGLMLLFVYLDVSRMIWGGGR